MENASGIWVDAEHAKTQAERLIQTIKLARWREYREDLKAIRDFQHHWFLGYVMFDKPRKKPLAFKKVKKLGRKGTGGWITPKGSARMLGFDEILLAKKVIRACNVPPADGRIFLTLGDVRDLDL